MLVAEQLAGDEGHAAALRAQVRRAERRLAREHELRFRLAEDPERLADDMETLFTLHDARWEPEGGSGAFNLERRAFHRDFARAALRRGWLRLWLAEVDGRPAAAWYGFRYAGRDWYYQMGRDPAWDRFKVGFVLLSHTIRDAFEAGVSAYHFGLGPEPYKDRFASHDPRLETVVLGRRPVVAVATRAVEVVRRLPKDKRHALLRRAG
jgi:CelD/BcsL family acetyltransferase involved in cellulose biosynthesis